HALDGEGDAARLEGVDGAGASGGDRAEPAGAGAGVAEDHERGGAAAPAVPDVRAVGLLAHGMEFLLAHERLQLLETGPRIVADLEPGGYAAAHVVSVQG